MLFWASLASGQIMLQKVDGAILRAVPAELILDLAAWTISLAVRDDRNR